MALPVDPSTVEKLGGLFPALFNLPDQGSLDLKVREAILDADAWMQLHMGANYNLLDTASARLQARGQACLALEYLVDTLKSQKVFGTHYPFVSEESPEYQTLIDLNWGEKALQALDTWVTVELGGARGFAMPQLLVSGGFGPKEKLLDNTFDPMTVQYSAENDFARGINNPDIGTVRR